MAEDNAVHGLVGAFHDDETPATEEIQKLIDDLKGDIHAKLGKEHQNLKAISFKRQIVAGTNFIVKIEGDDGHHFHAKIHQPLPHTGLSAELRDVQDNKTLQDQIELF